MGRCVRTAAGDRRRGDRADGEGPLTAAELAAFETLDLALPRALRAAVQLRADLGASGRLDLGGALLGGAALRRSRLRPGRPRARRRRRALVCGRAQGHGPLRPVGAARRDRPHRRARAAAGRRSRRLRLEDLLGFRRNPTTATPLFRGPGSQGARRSPHAGDALRAPGHRRLRRRSGELDRPGRRRRATASAPTARASTSPRARAGSPRAA